jgi:hypothetical protein
MFSQISQNTPYFLGSGLNYDFVTILSHFAISISIDLIQLCYV